MEKFKKQFGSHLKSLREKLNYTQEELSEIIDYNVVNISRLENGHVFPSLEIILLYAEAFGIEVKDLFNFDTEINTKKSNNLNRLNQLLKKQDDKYIKLVYDISKKILNVL